jgi:A/G-specific adenine glycosylase
MPAPFAERLLAWFDDHGRHDLPWQHPRDAYRVWLSEIMLQQTQVATVIPYFERFLQRFPDVQVLAAATIDDVLALWAGLGYYARARNLHRCAQAVVADHGGRFPRDLETMMSLPGIGRSTAGAILTQAYGERHPILDGNVRRVLARHGAVAGWPGQPKVQQQLWDLSERLLPQARLADYTQAIMDLGATLCTARTPQCLICPVAEDCRARIAGEIARYPGAKPKKDRPARAARLLLIRNDAGALLLERRPPVGIWGSLWSPPVLDDSVADDERSWCEQRGLQPLSAQATHLPPVAHAFTHYDLTLHPLDLQVRETGALQEPDRWRWVTILESKSLGLPAPIRKLLDRLPVP